MSDDQDRPYVVSRVPENWHSLSERERKEFVKEFARRLRPPPDDPNESA